MTVPIATLDCRLILAPPTALRLLNDMPFASTKRGICVFVALLAMAANAARGEYFDSTAIGSGLLPIDEMPSETRPWPSSAQPAELVVDLDGNSENWLGGEWDWQLLPSGLIYKSYLAGVKESRLASQHINVKGDGWLWDTTLGGRVGLLRYGDRDPIRPNGFQIDMEGSAQVRLDVPDDVNVRSVDFRGGLPITYGSGPSRFKFAIYHISSHVGDEFLLSNPGFQRLNYSRDVLVLGYTLYLHRDLRIYAELGWAFHSDVAEPWEFQFGVDYVPGTPTGIRGRPFFAVNGHLREEVDYGGNFVAQAGWAWLSDENARLLRIGAHYFNGHSSQFSFYRDHEQQLGLAVWYDF